MLDADELQELIADRNEYRILLEAVAEMRASQKRYFNTRSHADLLDAKRLESEVDQKLRDAQIDSLL